MMLRNSAGEVPTGLLLTGCMVTAPIRCCGLNESGRKARLPGGESGHHLFAFVPRRLEQE